LQCNACSSHSVPAARAPVEKRRIEFPSVRTGTPSTWNLTSQQVASSLEEEDLEVYQKAVDFADGVAALSERFPRGYGFLIDQLNRAALSIATNLAEGNGRFTKPDRLALRAPKHYF
jgi:hypothetical protein